MATQQVTIGTADGECPASVFTPDGEGPWPGVIFFMDGLGIRPTLFDMGERLAKAGYVVLLPDMFYRAGGYAPMNAAEVFAGGAAREALMKIMGSTSPEKSGADTGAFLDYLAGRPDVAGARVGTTGYCMGGAMALRAAGLYPDRVAAAASFHGGGLATDAETSPHLLAPAIKARVYVAGADQDAHYPAEMAQRLEDALSAAGVDHRCEIYDGALHGWTMADFPIFNPAAAERHWDELTALFKRSL